MAATMQNYARSTFLSDIITVPAFTQYVKEAIFERSLFVQSGAVVRNSALDARSGGVKVEVPTWKPLNPTETVIKSDATWGGDGTTTGYLDPKKIEAGKQTMPILHRGWAMAADDLSRLGAGTDPMAAIRSYTADAINKQKETALLSQLSGLYIGGSAPLAALTTDVADASAGDGAAANFLTAGSAIAARSTLGERSSSLSIIIMHSAMYHYLLQAGMLTFSSEALSTGTEIKWGGGGIGLQQRDVAFFAGMRIIVTDNIQPVAGGTTGALNKYPVYMCSEGAIAEGVQQELLIQADRNILSLQDVMAVSMHYGYHLQGTGYKGADNPANSVLATNGSWELIFTDARNIEMVCLLCNSPFGGKYT